MKNKEIGIIASDMRQIYMAQMLEERGYQTYVCDLMQGTLQQAPQKLYECSDLILPVPVSRLQDRKGLIEKLKQTDQVEHRRVFGGVFTKEWKEELQELQVEIIDVLEESDVAIQNSIATAEGAIAELMKLMPVNIQEGRIFLMGFGKCGKAIAERLYCLGADVVIIARRENPINLARFFGFEAYDISDDAIPYETCDGIVNTVPAQVVNRAIIDRLPKDAVILDIASAPGGCDGSYCKQKGVPYKLALGLPGQYSPKTSAEILLHAMPFD